MFSYRQALALQAVAQIYDENADDTLSIIGSVYRTLEMNASIHSGGKGKKKRSSIGGACDPCQEWVGSIAKKFGYYPSWLVQYLQNLIRLLFSSHHEQIAEYLTRKFDLFVQMYMSDFADRIDMYLEIHGIVPDLDGQEAILDIRQRKPTAFVGLYILWVQGNLYMHHGVHPDKHPAVYRLVSRLLTTVLLPEVEHPIGNHDLLDSGIRWGFYPMMDLSDYISCTVLEIGEGAQHVLTVLSPKESEISTTPFAQRYAQWRQIRTDYQEAQRTLATFLAWVREHGLPTSQSPNLSWIWDHRSAIYELTKSYLFHPVIAEIQSGAKMYNETYPAIWRREDMYDLAQLSQGLHALLVVALQRKNDELLIEVLPAIYAYLRDVYGLKDV